MNYEARIKYLTKQILESKDSMRVRYVVWTMAKQVEEYHKNKPTWTKSVIRSKLPESRRYIKKYTPQKFCHLLKGKDYETAATHLIWIISLYEALRDYAKIRDVDMRKIGITVKDTDRLDLAKEMRHRYVHNGGFTEEKFTKRFEKIMKRKPKYSNEGILLPEVKDVEMINDIIIKFAKGVTKLRSN